jgi:hypothetical protein
MSAEITSNQAIPINDVLTFLKIGIFYCFGVSVFADQRQWLAYPHHHCYCWRRTTYERKILGRRPGNDRDDGSKNERRNGAWWWFGRNRGFTP